MLYHWANHRFGIGEQMSKKNKKSAKSEASTEELTEQYVEQSMPASSQIVYKPKDGIVEGDPHFGDPMCYDCCGVHCCIELIAVLAIVLVCCAYGTDGTCCDYCYWPF